MKVSLHLTCVVTGTLLLYQSLFAFKPHRACCYRECARQNFHLNALDDREIHKAKKVFDKMTEKKVMKKDAKTQRKKERDSLLEPQRAPPSAATKPPKSFASKTISGQNIINCRPFVVDNVKKFVSVGSYTSVASIPVYPLPEIAFIGRSNVGKSSLLNTLTGANKKVAVEGKTAGRTQSINLFKCSDKEGDLLIFVDLPGYGYAKISKTQQEEIGIFLRDYLSDRTPLRLAVLLVDIRREVQQLDQQMINFLSAEGVPYIIVATKCDKMKKDELTKARDNLRKSYGLPSHLPIAFSSVTGDGRKEIWNAIKGGILGDANIIANSDEFNDVNDGEEEDDDETYYYDEDDYDGDDPNYARSEYEEIIRRY